jgi:hypothetical protein
MILDLVHWFLCTNIFVSVLESGKENDWKRVGCEQPTAAQSGCIGLSGGAPDSVRCAKMALANWPLSRIRRRRTATIHRTIRWCTGLSGEPTAASATVDHAIRARRVAPANGRLGGTEQCPVRQRLQFCNGRLCHFRKEIHTGQ